MLFCVKVGQTVGLEDWPNVNRYIVRGAIPIVMLGNGMPSSLEDGWSFARLLLFFEHGAVSLP